MASSNICSETGLKKKDCYCWKCTRNRNNAQHRSGQGRDSKGQDSRKVHDSKGRNNDDEHYGNDRTGANGSGRTIFVVLVAIIIGLGGYLTWQWLKQNSAPVVTTSVEAIVEPTVEPTDSLATPETPAPEATTEPTTTVAPITVPPLVTPLLPATYVAPQTDATITTNVAK